MTSLTLLRIANLALAGLLGLLLVHQTLWAQDRSQSRIHARDIVVSTPSHGWQARNLTIPAVTSSRSLAARALTFDTAVQKGSGLYCKCKARWQLSFESDWTSQDELERYWGAFDYDMGTDSMPASGESLQAALSGLGLPYELSSNNGRDGKLVPQYWVQNREWVTEVNTNGAVTRTESDVEQPTWGFYVSIMSPNAGLIIAENNRNPAKMSGGRVSPLNKWSDVVYLNWATLARATGNSVANLKYLVRFHIINLDTKAILQIACGGPCPAWPGKTFDINQKKSKGVLINQNGLALLGTPNGSGAAWLLINHKQQLGEKKAPVSVIAWTTVGKDDDGNDEDWYHMIFQFST